MRIEGKSDVSVLQQQPHICQYEQECFRQIFLLCSSECQVDSQLFIYTNFLTGCLSLVLNEFFSNKNTQMYFFTLESDALISLICVICGYFLVCSVFFFSLKCFKCSFQMEDGSTVCVVHNPGHFGFCYNFLNIRY